MQEGEKVRLDTEANISLAQRDLEVKKAQYQAEVERERATAEQSGPLSGAKARQSVVAEEVRIDKVRTQEQIYVQEQEILRREKELEATVVKPADAARTAAILKAEAAKQSAILEAEGKKEALIAMAEAEQERLRKEGQGRAAAIEAEGKAEAAKIEATGLAQAKAIEAQGVAEAAAILKKAEAWKQFNEAARLQTILERLPAIIQASAPVFGAVAAPLGNIDKVVVIEQGGGHGNGHGQGGVGRFAATAPTVIFGLLQQLEALGLNVPNLLAQLGVQPQTESAEASAEAVVIHCSDHRFQDGFREFLTNFLRLRSYALLAIPGGGHFLPVEQLLPKFAKVSLQSLSFLVKRGRPSREILIGHADCLFFKERLQFFFPETDFDQKQFANLRRAREAIRGQFPGLAVELYFADAQADGSVRFLQVG
jgi:hypothetical protein